MRCVRRFFVILLLLFLLTNNNMAVFAINTGFSTDALSDEDMDTFFNNISITVLTDEPEKKAIECFDVNEDGMIAVGHSTFEHKTIGIYTSEGVFEYGYNFNCSGTFGIEWDENSLIIYFVRSDIALSVNSTGEIENIVKIEDTLENNSYWNNYVFSTERNIGDIKYTLKNDMGILNLFSSSYSQLIITNSNGQEIVIYDVNATQFLSTLMFFICVIIFVCLVIVLVVFQFVKLKHTA